MALELPNLDDLTYDDLVAEAIRTIPTDAPEWTNHNPSDPGITLIELFAYLSEILLYRLNRVTDDNKRSFLKLLNGPDWRPSGTTAQDLAQDLKDSVLQLRRLERAVSCTDFETLALNADSRVARARCVPRRNLEMDFDRSSDGRISVIVVPHKDHESEATSIINSVQNYLEERRLLTTFLHVVKPQYLPITLDITVVRLPDTEVTPVTQSIRKAVQEFLHPLDGGETGKGWPFGRNVFVSEIYQLLDQLPEVDYVKSVNLTTTFSNRRIEEADNQGQPVFIGIEVKTYELVRELSDGDITIQIATE